MLLVVVTDPACPFYASLTSFFQNTLITVICSLFYWFYVFQNMKLFHFFFLVEPFVSVFGHWAIKNVFVGFDYFQNIQIENWKLWIYLWLQCSTEEARTARTYLLLIKYLQTSCDYSLKTMIALSMTSHAALIYQHSIF